MKPEDLLAADALLSDRVRLAIMATLASAREPVEFTALLAALDLTKGNLASHLRKLEDAKYIEVTKEFVERKPRTTYRCSDDGKRTLKEHLERLERALRAMKL